jgi:AcrR family transcriptional regulator
MVVGAVRLLAKRGLQATSFSEVLAATGAPRGSIYHHFPEGKEQMVAAALELAGEHARTAMEAVRGRPAAEVLARFLALWRQVLTASELSAGCAVVAVTVATDSEALLDHTAAIFRGWRAQLTGLLVGGGLEEDDAAGFAALMIAATEGAVVLARAERTLTPFDLVADQLTDQLLRIGG